MKKTLLLVLIFFCAIVLNAKEEKHLKIYFDADSTKSWEINSIQQIKFKSLDQNTRLNLFLKEESTIEIKLINIDSLTIVKDNNNGHILRLFLKSNIMNYDISTIDSITLTTTTDAIAKIDTVQYRTKEKIFLRSAYQDKVTQIDDQFEIKVSTVGTQLLFVIDGSQQLCGLTLSVIRNNNPEISLISAKSSAYALLMMTPGILTTDPKETEIVLSNFEQLQSMPKLIDYLKTNLSKKYLTTLMAEDETNVLIDSCISEYDRKFQPPKEKKIKIDEQGDEVYFNIDVKKEGVDNIVEFKNSQWRYVNVVRRDMDLAGNEKKVTSVLDCMGGATALSLGSILTMTVGEPTIAYDEKYKLSEDISRSQYWIIGPGFNLSANIEPPYTVNSDYLNAYGKTMVNYLILPFIDIFIGGLPDAGKMVTLTKAIWSAHDMSKELYDVYKNPLDYKKLAASATNIIKECLSYDIFLNVLHISGFANGVLKTTFFWAGFLIPAANVSILVNRLSIYPETYSIDIINPDFTLLKIVSVDKTTASIGETITITGTGFGKPSGYNMVNFNGKNTGEYLSWSPTEISLKVPLGAKTGKLSVTIAGRKSNEVDLIIEAPNPQITVVNPTLAKIGDLILITGSNFGSPRGSNFVTFNTVNPVPSDYQTWNPTVISLKVPIGAKTGKLSVTVAGVKSNEIDFSVRPFIGSVVKISASIGEEITITGSGFGNEISKTIVYFNTAATTDFVNWTPNSITLKVPADAETGAIYVSVDDVKSGELNFTVVPVIENLVKKSAAIGEEITIIGSGFGTKGEVGLVTFVGATTKEFYAWGKTLIILKVPDGAESGKLSLSVNGVKSNAADFVVLPQVASITPITAKIGNEITITGSGFGNQQGTSFVTIGNKNASVYNKWTSSEIKVKIPNGVTSFTVSVTVAGNKSNELDFKVIPDILSLTPTSAKIGDEITIKGTGFGDAQGASIVSFNSADAVDFVSWADEEIKVKVPVGAKTGKLSVTVNIQKSDEVDFTVLPFISAINPVSAEIGAEITLTGTSFGATRGTSVVSFTGADVSEYKSWVDTEIKVKVPVGATTGKLSVTVNNQKSNEFDFTVSTTSTDEVTIGTQVWMVKNLDVDHYRNGDVIPQVTDATEWANLTTGAWCYNDNDANNGTTYGKLYNWYAVNDSRGLAPEGWHVPSDEEWTTLSTYLGGESVAGGKLKEAGTTHWQSPNEGATNETGFSALPGGYRNLSGTFSSIGYYGYWWSSTESYTTYAWGRYLLYYGSNLYRDYYYKDYGFAVRCVKAK